MDMDECTVSDPTPAPTPSAFTAAKRGGNPTASRGSQNVRGLPGDTGLWTHTSTHPARVAVTRPHLSHACRMDCSHPTGLAAGRVSQSRCSSLAGPLMA